LLLEGLETAISGINNFPAPNSLRHSHRFEFVFLNELAFTFAKKFICFDGVCPGFSLAWWT